MKEMILSKTVQGQLQEFFKLKFVPQVFVALCVMVLILIFAIIVGIVIKKADYTKKPKGLVLLAMLFYNLIENFTLSIMPRKHRNFTGVMLTICPYLFLCFIIGLTGLPSPIMYLSTPLSLALVVFIFVHGTAIKENHWGYFKRYVDPFPVFLPINLVSMWAPTLSLTFRLFGNAVSGYCIMSLVYFSLESLSNMLFGLSASGVIGYQSIVLAPIITPVLHLYFDLFSGFIQTFVFSMLMLIFVSQEQNNDDAEDVVEKVIAKA